MSFIQRSLGANEKLLCSAEISYWPMAPWITFAVVVFYMGANLPNPGGVMFWGVVLLVYGWLRYRSTELGITDKKVVAKYGLIKRDTIELLLPKIESIQVRQSILGRIFNYGSIIVAGAGTPQAPVPGIHAPMVFRQRFMEIQEKTPK
ncbi:MAG: PH domain-containing protein [Pseudomonadota bacterium]